MAKSKWYNWLLNPVGALVNNLTDGSKPGGFGEAINHIINPSKNFTESALFNKKARGDLAMKTIEKEADKAGMALDEFLYLNPDKKEIYENPDKNFVDEILENPHVKSAVENATGERDTAENEKNRQFQHDEAEINRQWEAEQAKAAREWDSIGAQMERAAAAGVNPISIAMQNGGINSSATTSIPSASGYPTGSAGLMHSGALDIAGKIFEGIGTLAENRLKQSQADDIIVMRQYNVAKSIAETDHLQKLCAGVDLSNTAQSIQNSWLNVMNQATYDGMLLENGVSRETILEKRSIRQLNAQQIASVQQSMDLALKEFNAKLPLELQLMDSEINNKNMSTKDIYSEITMRFLQSIEQENRNRQSAAEAESAEVETSIKKQTMEDAISAFHNSMLKGAAEAGISLNDYQYWSVISHNPTEAAGKAMLQLKDLDNKRKNLGRKIFGGKQVPYYGIGERSNEMISW